MIIEDSSTSKIIMDDKQLKEITDLTENVRKILLK